MDSFARLGAVVSPIENYDSLMIRSLFANLTGNSRICINTIHRGSPYLQHKHCEPSAAA
jgi:hypothetical protein